MQAMQAEDMPRDEVPRTFGGAMHALTWAYETIEKGASYAQPSLFPSQKGRAMGTPPEDFQDLAYTILTVLSTLSSAEAAGVLRAMAAEPEARGYWLARMAGWIAASVDWPDVRLSDKAQRGMAMVAILRMQDELERPDARARELRPEKAEYARAAGVPAQSISSRQRWMAAVERLEDAVRHLRHQGLSELRARLQEAGIVRANTG